MLKSLTLSNEQLQIICFLFKTDFLHMSIIFLLNIKINAHTRMNISKNFNKDFMKKYLQSYIIFTYEVLNLL